MENIANEAEDLNVDYDILNKLYNERYEEMLYQSGVLAAREEGMKETSKEIAINLLEAGIDIEIISNTTWLSVEEINMLT